MRETGPGDRSRMTNKYSPLFLRVSDKGKPLSESLRQAFKDEIKLNDYLVYIWYTAIVAAVVLCFQTMLRSSMPGTSEIVLANLFPTDGSWHAYDAGGKLYVETWSTILVNSLQIAFAVWGTILFALGIKRLLSSHKYFFGCFSLGLTFCGFAWFLPMMSQPILQMLVDRLPFLVG
jgi:hypothetical protein